MNEVVTFQGAFEAVDVILQVFELDIVESIWIKALQRDAEATRGSPVVFAAVGFVFAKDITTGDHVRIDSVLIQVADRHAISIDLDFLHQHVHSLVSIVTNGVALSLVDEDLDKARAHGRTIGTTQSTHPIED